MRLNFSSLVKTLTRACALSKTLADVSQTVLFDRGPFSQSGNSAAEALAANTAVARSFVCAILSYVIEVSECSVHPSMMSGKVHVLYLFISAVSASWLCDMADQAYCAELFRQQKNTIF